MQTDTQASVAPVFAALGEPNRLVLILRLSDGHPQSISQLTAGMDLTRQGVTKHLDVLERARVVAREKVGRETRYRLRAETLTEAGDYLQRASRQWDDAVERLRLLVEE